MTPRYRVCGLGADGLLIDTRAPAADCLIWRGPYAVAVELAGLAEEISQRPMFDAMRYLTPEAETCGDCGAEGTHHCPAWCDVPDCDTTGAVSSCHQRTRARNFDADTIGRELGRALVQARPWTVLTL